MHEDSNNLFLSDQRSNRLFSPVGGSSTLFFVHHFSHFNRLYLLLCHSGTNDEQLRFETGACSECVYLTHFPPKSAGTVTCSHKIATTKLYIANMITVAHAPFYTLKVNLH